MLDADIERPPAKAVDSARLFWRFWTAATLSSAGTAVTAIAMPLLAVLALKATTFQVGMLAAAANVAWLLISLPAGAVVGRLPLRGTQVAMDLFRAAAVISVPVTWGLGVLTFPQLVIVALAVGFASVVFDVGNSTFLTSLVSDEELAKRNSLNTGSDATVQLGGPALGGLLVQVVGAPVCLLLDSVSYLSSAVLLRSLPRPAPATASGPATSIATLIGDGWRYVVRHKVIRPSASAAALVNMTCGGLMALTPVFLVRTLGASAGLVGLVVATEGLGSMVGAALAVPLGSRVGSARAIMVATLGAAASLVLLPLAWRGWGLVCFGVGNLGFAAGVAVLSIHNRTHRQIVTPRELLPRVMATVRFVSWGAIPVGAVAAGAIASAIGSREALAIACVPAGLAPLVLWLSPVRHQRDLC